MHWLTMALVSAALLGLYEVSRKSAVRDNAVLPVLFVANLGGLTAFFVILALAHLLPKWTGGLSFEIRTLSGLSHLMVFAKACIVTTSWVCAYFAVKHLPLSIAAPLRSLSPAVTVLGALLIFQESPRPSQWFSMAIIFAGYLGFAWIGKKEGIHFAENGWVLLLLAGTFIGAMSGLYDKYLLQKVRLDATTMQLWFTVYNLGLQGVLCALLWWRRRRDKPFQFRPTVPLVGALLVLADQFYFRALSDESALVSVVAIARRASVLVSFTLGGLLFGEQLLKKKALALMVLLVGLVALLRG